MLRQLFVIIAFASFIIVSFSGCDMGTYENRNGGPISGSSSSQ